MMVRKPVANTVKAELDAGQVAPRGDNAAMPFRWRLLMKLAMLIQKRPGRRGHPTIPSIRDMGPERFQEYIRATGIEAHLIKAISESMPEQPEPAPDSRVTP